MATFPNYCQMPKNSFPLNAHPVYALVGSISTAVTTGINKINNVLFANINMINNVGQTSLNKVNKVPS